MLLLPPKRGCLGPGADLLRQEEWVPREWVSTRREPGKELPRIMGRSRGPGPAGPQALGAISGITSLLMYVGIAFKRQKARLLGGARCVCSANGVISIKQDRKKSTISTKEETVMVGMIQFPLSAAHPSGDPHFAGSVCRQCMPNVLAAW